MSNLNGIRIYDLARELKQNVKRIIEDLRREGADVSVPSNTISKELAEKVRSRYFPKIKIAPKRQIKILKKTKKENTVINSKSSIKITQGQKLIISDEDILRYFDLMKEMANTINKIKFNSVDFASYLNDSQRISQFTSPAH